MIDKILNFGWMILPRLLQINLWIGSIWLMQKSFPYFYPLESIGMIIIVIPTYFLSLCLSVLHDVLHDKEWVQHARKFPDYD